MGPSTRKPYDHDHYQIVIFFNITIESETLILLPAQATKTKTWFKKRFKLNVIITNDLLVVKLEATDKK